MDDVLDELDSREEVEYIREIMKMGTGADRQLQVYRKTGDMKAVVDYIIEETEVGVDMTKSIVCPPPRPSDEFDEDRHTIPTTTESACL